jgi:hypothetical protein
MGRRKSGDPLRQQGAADYLQGPREGRSSLMSVPTDGDRVEQQPALAAGNRWGTIRYALDSTARTLRLCLIMLAASIPPALLMLLIRHY